VCDLQERSNQQVPLNLEDKKALVKEVAEIAATSQSVVAAEYRGITVSQMTELRAKARAQGVYMRVVKNTLARKAVAGTSFEAIGPKLKGPLVLAFSKDDPGAAARVVKDFAKANDKLVATLVSLGGDVLPGSDVEKVAVAADARTGPVDALGTLKAPIREVRAHRSPHRAPSWSARVAAVRDAQAGRWRLNVVCTLNTNYLGVTTMAVSAGTKSSTQLPT
jgi:large subunit ribosomal protein L10